jgi:TP901 family phage tail tape measure protein
MSQIGYSTLAVLPSFKDFGPALTKGIAPEMAAAGKTSGETFAKGLKVGALAVAVLAVSVGVMAAKMASSFQASTTQIVTGAGESEKSIESVRQGILKMAGTVGAMPEELSKGFYLIASAGYHGAQGLDVLKAAAEGAKVGGADLATVAGALTTALTDYNIPASRSNAVTSALVQTVASGKMHMEDLAKSLGLVMPKASALGVSFQDVTGALATMTSSGMTARRASMNLASTILALGAPSKIASDAMAGVGLSAQQVKDSLSSKGLAGTLELIETHVGKTFPKGSVAAVTALKDMLGGATGYGTALALTGTHMKAFETNVKNIGGALNGQNSSVQGFALVQKDLGFQVDRAKATFVAWAITLETNLLPVLTKVMAYINDTGIPALKKLWDMFQTNILPILKNVATFITGTVVPALKDMGQWVGQNKDLFLAIGIGVAAALVSYQAYVTYLAIVKAATAAWAAVQNVLNGSLLANPIGLIVVAIGALVAGVIYAYTHFQAFHDIVNNVWNGIQSVAGVVIGWFTTTAMPALTTLWNVTWAGVVTIWNTVGKPLFDGIVLLVQAWWAGVQIEFNLLATAWNLLWTAVSAAWNAFGKPLFDLIGTAIGLWWNNWVKPLWDALTTAWGVIWTVVSTVWNTVGKPLFDLIGTVIGLWWNIVLKPTWDALTALWNVTWTGVTTMWNAVGAPLFAVIGTVVGLWWAAIKLVWDALTLAWGVIWTGVTTVWNTVGKPLFDGIGTVIGAWWNNVLKPVWDALTTAWGVLWGAVVTAWNTVGKPIFDGIGTVVSDLWNNILKPTFVLIVGGFLDLVGKFVDGAAKAFGWVHELGPKLQQAARDFDTFKTNTMNAINGISGKTVTVGVIFSMGNSSGPGGTSSIPGVVLHARGGPVTGGVRGYDSVVDLLKPGEFVVRDDGSNLGEAISHYGARRWANGGLVVDTKFPSAAGINDTVNAGFAAFLARIDFSGAATSAMSSAAGGSVGGGAAQWAGLVLQVLTMMGQPLSLLAGVLRLINKESGGNPRAINLTDTNAMMGTPSMGLIQTILPTFLAYAGPFAALGPYNPLANLYAGLHRAIAAWGSIAAVDPLVHAGGYANGTNNAAPGYAWVGERGKELVHYGGGEQVTPNNQLGNGETRLHRDDMATISAMIGAAVADGLKSAANSTQLVSRNRPAW